jgi:hypothetical protein
MAGESYANGMNYEIFIRRAFKCERGKHGAETSLLRFLLEADGGNNNLSGPYSKQFEKVKSYLTKAIDKFISRKPTNEELKGLIQLKEEVLDAPNASALVSIIRYGLDLTHRYRDL